MQPLNFPDYEFRFKGNENDFFIFDIVRKKFVPLKPEEWVRQHVIMFLFNDKGYPLQLLSVEKQLIINKMQKRYDLVGYFPNGKINLVVECKAPTVEITQETFDQIARYNMILKANYLMVTNGINHYYCEMDYKNEKYVFKKNIPKYKFKKEQ